MCHSQYENDFINTLTIPEKELPAKPNQSHMESLKDFLQKNEVKNKELLNIMKETALKTEEEKPMILENETFKKAEASLKKSGVSEKLLAKVFF